ncbi:MAG: sterol-binding domain-containing protein [Hyphomonadaceae bacterium]|nr:MAG: sterol-binding domain-containing protein [Hyphomonadaceae bacterium]KAF0183291.1 MAG: sterol-binding domain-containing protein [Hyphomonadaceae bacterium]
MDLSALTAAMAAKSGSSPALGKTVKFDFGADGCIYVNGADGNKVSNDNNPADCTIGVSMADFIELSEGRLEPMTAFFSGKLKVDGDMSVAMQLQTILG